MWQPIETAPKDQNDILGYCEFMSGDFSMQSIFWGEGQQRWLASRVDRDEEAFPSHWMPLPDPPA